MTARRRVLITGGTRGIGAGLARAFADDGAAVGLIGRDEDRLTATARTLGSGVSAWRSADVGDRERICQAIDEIAAELGGLDVLINNAGIARWVRIDTPLATAERLWDEVLTTNLKGAFLASLAAVSLFRRAAATLGWVRAAWLTLARNAEKTNDDPIRNGTSMLSAY